MVPGRAVGRRADQLLRTPAGRPSRSSCCRGRSPTCRRRGREFEIFVYSPRLEGVHLRFGPVARGGLRWSDRAEDFRTEILGLVKAQMVKNTVIVPVGAKGGFYAKRLPDPPSTATPGWPRAWRATSSSSPACSTSPTTSSTGHVVPPTDVIRYDGDDPYLVVAADKGTATFSDIANQISRGPRLLAG